MNRTRFDHGVMQLQAGIPRRRLIASALGLFGLAVGTERVSAKKKKRCWCAVLNQQCSLPGTPSGKPRCCPGYSCAPLNIDGFERNVCFPDSDDWSLRCPRR